MLFALGVSSCWRTRCLTVFLRPFLTQRHIVSIRALGVQAIKFCKKRVASLLLEFVDRLETKAQNDCNDTHLSVNFRFKCGIIGRASRIINYGQGIRLHLENSTCFMLGELSTQVAESNWSSKDTEIPWINSLESVRAPQLSGKIDWALDRVAITPPAYGQFFDASATRQVYSVPLYGKGGSNRLSGLC